MSVLKEANNMPLWFKDARHEAVYRELQAKTRVTSGRDILASLYVLAAIEKEGLPKYVSEGSIDFASLLETSKPWSSGEKALAKLAATLFNSTAWPATTDEVFYSLDADNFRVATEALALRYNHQRGVVDTLSTSG